MKKNYVGLGLAFTIALSTIAARAQQIISVEEYNKTLIKNGVAWSASQGTYLPSFYTGFAPRIEDPNRIHYHLARGNQIRVTTQLDEYAIFTYMYGLTKRESLFDKAVSENLIRIQQQNQLGSFKAIMNSPKYNIKGLIQGLEAGTISREQFYQKSLQVLEQLNQDRVFHIKLNLSGYVSNWKRTVDSFMIANGATAELAISKNAQKTIVLVNDLLPGRINISFVTPEIKAKLAEAMNNRNDATAFEKSSLELLKIATKGRYEFKTLRDGKLQSAIYQSGPQTFLEYPEFTAIYPNGSVRTYTTDRDGNKIPVIREIGALNFTTSAGNSDVDHIRGEGYYGYIPKMDYTTTGNGMHNPAVRTSLKKSIYKNLYADLAIPAANDTLWIVARGGVSHGCTRMAAGHVLEVREIFPSDAKRMRQVNYFANQSTDYDLFDINGDGQLKVMGVQYYLAYAIGGDEGEAYREGAGLIPESLNRDAFLNNLYGKNQFRTEGETYKFINPYMSQFAYDKSADSRGKAFSIKLNGEFNLYEQKYEQDKMQFYKLSSTEMGTLQSNGGDNGNTGKMTVRLFGRAAGCGIFKTEYPLCNEDNFDKELNALTSKITKVK
ncbi:MAG: hypothetical protein H7256_04685 [Bdellovibrio sp.]|nr:hypothetical protein [Bdellovibrio sp.]